MYKIPESVLVIIHTADLQVLMIKRADKSDFWQSVTGSKDTQDELLRQTAIREVSEETGIVVGNHPSSVPLVHLQDWHLTNVYEIYPTWRHRYAPGITKNAEHVFSLLVPASIEIILSPREHVEYRWLPYLEAADLCFSASNAEAILQLPHHVEHVKKI
ncbi:MAG: dihydroneopterin triphosphate diphosphatase [Glaciimonas sp.]|nr:dihydroneopterin triphosphate diphosphatase [Glaciimonas sp.]